MRMTRFEARDEDPAEPPAILIIVCGVALVLALGWAGRLAVMHEPIREPRHADTVPLTITR